MFQILDTDGIWLLLMQIITSLKNVTLQRNRN